MKGKFEQSREKSSALPLDFDVVAIEKGAFGSPSSMVVQLTIIIIIIININVSVEWLLKMSMKIFLKLLNVLL